MMKQLCAAAPVFVVRDVLASVDHYCNVLGFTRKFVYGDPVFHAGLERDDVTIHLHGASKTKRQPGQASLYVFVADVDGLFAELKSKGAKTVNEPKDYPYGMRDFNVEDLDGNDLCFGMESRKS